MTQIGELVAVAIDPAGNENCIFCGKDHQDDEPVDKHKFSRDMGKLKREGRQATTDLGRSARYPDEEKPPLVEWSKDISKTGGYKAAAHHCIALKSVSDHEISGELNNAGYDPNQGSNCIWLPYSRVQFVRARAYHKALQKHRGGHTNEYFTTVEKHIDKVAENVAKIFCTQEKKADKERFLRFMNQQENRVWLGVASASFTPYHLYNNSFLDPKSPWGAFDEEKGKTPSDYLGEPVTAAIIADDVSAEAESAEDPE